MSLASLPRERQAIYDNLRRPKIYCKTLKGDRDVDVEDAFWTRDMQKVNLKFCKTQYGTSNCYRQPPGPGRASTWVNP